LDDPLWYQSPLYFVSVFINQSEETQKAILNTEELQNNANLSEFINKILATYNQELEKTNVRDKETSIRFWTETIKTYSPENQKYINAMIKKYGEKVPLTNEEFITFMQQVQNYSLTEDEEKGLSLILEFRNNAFDHYMGLMMALYPQPHDAAEELEETETDIDLKIKQDVKDVLISETKTERELKETKINHERFTKLQLNMEKETAFIDQELTQFPSKINKLANKNHEFSSKDTDIYINGNVKNATSPTEIINN
jgi:hypothetical protein